MDAMSKYLAFSGLGQAGAGLAQLFGGSDNPADAGMDYLNQIPKTLKPYYQPYINAGQGAMGQLQGQYGNLVNDPTAMMNQIGSHYQQSPGYQFQVGQAQGAANNAAAAGGMLGSPEHQYNSANMVNQLANQDYYNYLNHGLGLYGQGLQGLGGLNTMGYGASSELGNNLASTLGAKAQLGYEGAAGQNKQEASALGGVFGGLSSLLPFLGML